MQASQSIHRKIQILIEYSHGDIYHLSPIMATLYAIISKIETYDPLARQGQYLE
jgi:hypothetical protein